MHLDKYLTKFLVGSDKDGDNKVDFSSRGDLVIVSCESGRYMAERIKSVFDKYSPNEKINYMMACTTRFADGEIGCRFGKHVGGKDVFIVQALFDPRFRERLEEAVSNIVKRARADLSYDYSEDVRNLPPIPDVNSNLKELEIVARTARVNGAMHVTAIVPYLAYSRQDKPTDFKRECVASKLIADQFYTAGIDKVITWHAHSPQIRGFYEREDNPGSNFLSPVDFFIDCFERFKGNDNVKVVSLDAGGAKTVMNVALGLDVDFGVGSKDRPQKDVAKVNAFAADFSHTNCIIIIDDVYSTGGSFKSGIQVLVEQAKSVDSDISDIEGGVSHFLSLGKSMIVLKELNDKYNFKKLYTTDSIPLTKTALESGLVEQFSIAPLISLVVNRVHYDMSLQNVFWNPKED